MVLTTTFKDGSTSRIEGDAAFILLCKEVTDMSQVEEMYVTYD
jgi:hypothetical protein